MGDKSGCIVFSGGTAFNYYVDMFQVGVPERRASNGLVTVNIPTHLLRPSSL